MYIVWINVADFPLWIELEGEYKNRKEAKEAAEQALRKAKTKIMKTANKKKLVKVFSTAKVAS